MTPYEWNLVASVLENCWKTNDWDEARANSYYLFLAPFEAPEVERALHLLVRNGNPFVPAVAEIIAAIESQARAGIPTWPEALTVVRRIVPRYTGRQDDGLVKLAEVHPHLASFVASYGWDRLAREPIDDPDHGGAVLRRIEIAYGEHVDRQEDRRRQGLAIEAVQRRRITGPRRMDAARLLGAGGVA